MIAGTVGEMAGGDAAHYAAIASLAGFTVALLYLISWLLRLSILVRLISDSILVGFKAGAGLTIIMTQLPSVLGVSGGGHIFFERAVLLFGELDNVQYLVLTIGLVAIAVLLASGFSREDRWRSPSLCWPLLPHRFSDCLRSAYPLLAKSHRACRHSPCRLCAYAMSKEYFLSERDVFCSLVIRKRTVAPCHYFPPGGIVALGQCRIRVTDRLRASDNYWKNQHPHDCLRSFRIALH